MLFGLSVRGRRPFLRRGLGLLRSGVHLRQLLRLGLGSQREQLSGGLLLIVGIDRG